MIFSFSTFMFVFLTSIASIKAAFPCPPAPAYTWVSHETDCHKFYQCHNGGSYLFTCPSNLEFNPVAMVCDWPFRAKCSAKAPTTTTTTTTTTEAPPQPACDYFPEPDEIPPNKHFDLVTCTFVCNETMPSPIPSYKHYVEETCSIECIEPYPEEILPNQRYNQETCSTECIIGESTCSWASQTWDEDKCTCNCEVEREGPVSCPPGQFFDPKHTCSCVEQCSPSFGECPLPYEAWCPETCQCECRTKDVPLYCGPGRHWNNQTCQCDCDNSETLDCSYNPNYEFKSDTCTCGCFDSEDFSGYCSDSNPLWSWDTAGCRCSCADASEKATCSNPLGPKRWNATTCDCVCKLNPVCDPILHRFNNTTCTCDCLASPPEGGCPPGFSWDKTTCTCFICSHCL